VAKSPCSRRTSPASGEQRVHVATTEQVWALHDAVPEHLRAAVLLGAFAGLRLAEACGLRVSDVDFMRGVVSPAVQYPAEPLKSETSRASIPVGQSLALALAGQVGRHPSGGGSLLLDQLGRQLAPWTLERAIRRARSSHVAGLGHAHAKQCTGCLVPGLPPDFRFHDLRHYFAPPHRLWCGREGRPGAAAARERQDDAGHLRPPVARLRGADGRAAVDAALAARTRSAAAGATNKHEGPPTAKSADPRADSLRTTGGLRP